MPGTRDSKSNTKDPKEKAPPKIIYTKSESAMLSEFRASTGHAKAIQESERQGKVSHHLFLSYFLFHSIGSGIAADENDSAAKQHRIAAAALPIWVSSGVQDSPRSRHAKYI